MLILSTLWRCYNIAAEWKNKMHFSPVVVVVVVVGGASDIFTTSPIKFQLIDKVIDCVSAISRSILFSSVNFSYDC